VGIALAGALASGLVVAPADAGASRAAFAKPVRFTIQLEDQILAQLQYLPVRFKPYAAKVTTPTTTTTTTTTTLPSTTTTLPTGTVPSTTTPTTTTTLAPAKRPKKPAKLDPTVLHRGTYVWRFPKLPRILRGQWRFGTNNVVLRGALMNFQSVHGLATTGAMDPTTWRTLVAAARSNARDPSSYNYVLVNRALPQTLKLYVNGGLYFTTLVNTGISVAPTASGTYPVYLRYVTTTMSGTLPDGKPYSDSGIPWTSYFNGGDALHGFIRASYGWPQSLGCVEMPFSHARVVWPHTPIGTLVTVI
jgi:L,D-transpeptidase catalytic domain